MAIQAGQRLGPFEILSAIGAGGMGEVYKARDTRLDRIVAIKVLPTHLADRTELRERFEREAKSTASLNHPHICTLYDTGHQDGIDFLVMEYLEGETLAQRLQKGALPIQQVLQYGIEISNALDKAHRKGITHRDLKPGNIMLTKTGSKLLDFGLAKLQQENSPANAGQATLLPTGEAVTAQGTVLGTLEYMAPEQVEGKTDQIDARTDIFAFGVVLYEMATGRKAFEGKSQASLMAKILETDPTPMSTLAPMTPPALDRVVKKCLAKEPEKRWQDAGDLCDELKWIAEGGSRAPSVVPSLAKGFRQFDWRLLGLSGSALLLVAAFASFVTWRLKFAPPHPVTRTVINMPPGDQLAALDYPAIAISPDGTQVAYVAIHSGTRQVFLRALDSLVARPLAGTEGANTPFFSPDGQWLGFFAGSKLMKISVNGGLAVALTEGMVNRGATWTSIGKILFTPNSASGIQEVSDQGGAPLQLTRLEPGEISHRWPEALPDGQAFLFSTGNANPQIAVQSLRSGKRVNLVAGGVAPRYVASGHLVYAQFAGGNLMAVAFDPKLLQVRGIAVPVIDGVLQLTGGRTQYDISATGSLVYIPGTPENAAQLLVWVSRNGSEQALTAPLRAYGNLRISPDGRRVAVSINEQEQGTRTWQTWLYDLGHDTLTRLTFGGYLNYVPVWTPDGKRIAFMSTKEGPANVSWQLSDGSGGLERLMPAEAVQIPGSFSPDGQLMAYSEISPTTGYDIWVLRLSDRKAQLFLRTPSNEGGPAFSPDGHWLAYVSDESGRYEVYVQPYPGPGGKYEISTDGGTEPVWNPNGRELFYRSGGKMMAVDVATLSGFSVGKPRMLFQGPYVPTAATMPLYDVSPDGQRFLMVKPREQTSSSSLTQIVVVQNWFEELKQKVPAGKK